MFMAIEKGATPTKPNHSNEKFGLNTLQLRLKRTLVLAGEHEAGGGREGQQRPVRRQRARRGGAVHQQHAVVEHLP